MNKSSRIYVAGHSGLVGSAIVRKLRVTNHHNLLFKTHSELDLRDQTAVEDFFKSEQPEYVFLAAARVGGILANSSYPADFIMDNLAIQLNVIRAAHQYKTQKLLFLGSACIYPRISPQPISEDFLLSGPLEPTNEWYAIAKIAGIKMCQALKQQHGFNAISAMPTNLYGPGDNFDLNTSHVLPALMRKFHEAKVEGKPSMTVWGSGTPRREFLYVDDLADALVFLMNEYEEEQFINVGSGVDQTIQELAELIRNIVGYKGRIEYDTSKPDGMPRKLVDTSRLFARGWRPKVSLRDGLTMMYEWYVENINQSRRGSLCHQM